MSVFLQHDDPKTRGLQELLKKTTRSSQEQVRVEDFEQMNGILYRICGKRWLFVVPSLMLKDTVIAARDLNGHFVIERTITRIMEDYWLPAICEASHKYAHQLYGT